MDGLTALVLLAVVLVIGFVVVRLLTRRPSAPPFVPPAQHYAMQREAVTEQGITYRTSRIMGRGEYELFRAALNVTGQQMPRGALPFYVFPQVALGQIIRTEPATGPEADRAYRAINSKRCDLLLADMRGNPVAVLEYQGSGHEIGGTAAQRDEIKRMALSRAGVRYVEIRLRPIVRWWTTAAIPIPVPEKVSNNRPEKTHNRGKHPRIESYGYDDKRSDNDQRNSEDGKYILAREKLLMTHYHHKLDDYYGQSERKHC